MGASETLRPDRWPDAMERWLPSGPAEPGTAAMPPLSCIRRGAVAPMCLSSHATDLPESASARTWNRSTCPGATHE
jgi:hypothetical protein